MVAAKMAMEDFGGRVLGLPIEVIGADHLNKADVGANKVREWYDTQNVDMVTDALNSAVAIAIGKVSHEKNKLAMIVGAGSSRLSNEDCNPNTIHYAYDTYALGNISGNAVVKAGGKSWFFLTADYAFGHSLESDTAGWVKKSGGEVKGAVRHPLNASDFSSFLLQAQASKAQVVALAKAAGGKLEDPLNVAGLLKDVTFSSPRGPVRFDARHQAVATVYFRRVERAEGSLRNTVIDTIENVDQAWRAPN